MPTDVFVNVQSQERLRGPGRRGPASEIWVPICFALIPFMAFALAMVLMQDGAFSRKSVKRVVIAMSEISCLEAGACP